ncbi:hypothetical protein [Prauserella cavernicola]|uniref:Secreted protein n=1 Tax=Prauserella cavernicola TaxID=2800127 RepID=A0A934QPV1_9PSEU|nr:hypothetical protein [Prauserella cavernicola]MBK1783858.1 hypothetical protein [Prauserella cavernicola]
MTQPKNRASKLALFTAAPLLIALLSGCGGGSGDDASSTGGQSGSQEPSASASFEDYQLDLAQCMRDQGIDMPDPSGGSVELKGGDSAALQQAMETCREKLGPPPAPDGGPALTDDERYEQQLESAKCFRDNGIEVPDPKRGEASEMVDAPADIIEKCTAQRTGAN